MTDGGSARSLRSLAEWCAPPNKTRRKDGRRGIMEASASRRCTLPTARRSCPHTAALTIPRHAVAVSGISFLTPNAVRHSARRESVERNLLRGDVACHGFCTNLPIFCENFTRFWTEIFLFSCNYLYSSEKKSYQQVNNSRQSVLSL